MSGAPGDPPPPLWAVGASRRAALVRGVLDAPSIPVFVALATFIGFGALARDVGLDLGQAVFVTVSVFALPGQVVLVDQVAYGAGLVAAAFAVALTAVRLLPMTVALMPVVRDEASPRWPLYATAHLVAITVWIESMRRLPPLPRPLRVAYFASFGTTVALAAMGATAIGHGLAAQVPAPVAAGLIFMSPIYFFLSLVAAMQTHADAAAVIAGAVLGPLMFLVAPGVDLMLTGLIAGTGAYLLARAKRRS